MLTFYDEVNVAVNGKLLQIDFSVQRHAFPDKSSNIFDIAYLNRILRPAYPVVAGSHDRTGREREY